MTMGLARPLFGRLPEHEDLPPSSNVESLNPKRDILREEILPG